MDETRTTKIMRQIKEVCEIAGIRTEEYARVTKKRLDLLGLSRELAREKASLGDRVFDLSREESPGSVFEDVTVQAVIARITNLESSLGDLEEEISTIRDSASDRTTDVKLKYKAPDAEASADSWQASVPPAAGAAGAAVATVEAEEVASDSSVVEVTVEEGPGPSDPLESPEDEESVEENGREEEPESDEGGDEKTRT